MEITEIRIFYSINSRETNGHPQIGRFLPRENNCLIVIGPMRPCNFLKWVNSQLFLGQHVKTKNSERR